MLYEYKTDDFSQHFPRGWPRFVWLIYYVSKLFPLHSPPSATVASVATLHKGALYIWQIRRWNIGRIFSTSQIITSRRWFWTFSTTKVTIFFSLKPCGYFIIYQLLSSSKLPFVRSFEKIIITFLHYVPIYNIPAKGIIRHYCITRLIERRTTFKNYQW